MQHGGSSSFAMSRHIEKSELSLIMAEHTVLDDDPCRFERLQNGLGGTGMALAHP